MEGITKSKGFGIAATVLITAPLIGVVLHNGRAGRARRTIRRRKTAPAELLLKQIDLSGEAAATQLKSEDNCESVRSLSKT